MKHDIDKLTARLKEAEARLAAGERLAGFTVRACVVIDLGDGKAVRTDIGGQGFDFMTRKHVPMPADAIEALKAGIADWRVHGVLPSGWVLCPTGVPANFTQDLEPIDPAKRSQGVVATPPLSPPTAAPAPARPRRVIKLGR